MTLRICVSILPKNLSEALNLIKKAEAASADLIELRLDLLKATVNLSHLVNSTKIPLIATNKLQSENGFFPGSEIERQQILFAAAKNGFSYVDVDYQSPLRNETVKTLRDLNTKPIVSYHNFNGIISVSEMEKILNEQITIGAHICKIVLTANQIEDNLSVLSFVSFASTKANLVCFCIGKNGKISRILSPALGGFFTFASLESGSETANGQMSIKDMKTAYNLLGIK